MADKTLHLRYHGLFWKITGTRSLKLITSASTIIELLEELATRHDSTLHSELFTGQNLNVKVIVLINGQNIYHLQGAQTEIKSGDTVQLMPQVAGG